MDQFHHINVNHSIFSLVFSTVLPPGPQGHSQVETTLSIMEGETTDEPSHAAAVVMTSFGLIEGL